MSFIRFTQGQSAIFINSEKIVSIHPMPPGTQIYTEGGGFTQVDQDYGKVLFLIGQPLTTKEKKDGNKTGI